MNRFPMTASRCTTRFAASIVRSTTPGVAFPSGSSTDFRCAAPTTPPSLSPRIFNQSIQHSAACGCLENHMKIKRATKLYEQWLGQQLAIVKRDLAQKHRNMASDPFIFLRATYYRWAQRWTKVCPELA